MELIKVILTSLFSAVSLFAIAKIIGHKQMAQLDFFDYITGITIGSIAAELATELESPWKPFIAMVIYGAVSLGLTITAHKFPKTRKFINGTPTVIMNNGKIYRKNMKKAKLDLSEFLLLCRMQGYFDLDDIQTAIYEHNGKLSVLPVSTKRPVTPHDMNLELKAEYIGTEVIMDGRIMGENLLRIGRDENWLQKQLESQGYYDAKEIFLGIYHAEDDTLSLYSNN